MSLKPLNEAHRKALIKVGEDALEKLRETKPEIYEKTMTETEKFIEKYNVPSPGGSFGGLWDSDCPRYVRDLLGLSNRYGRPLRIVVQPESFDMDAHHWTVSYEWLKWDEHRGWVSLKELERPKTR